MYGGCTVWGSLVPKQCYAVFPCEHILSFGRLSAFRAMWGRPPPHAPRWQMKVQCEQCGAAYSVADEKVAGRKLRQRCRKCGEPIIIDGSALEGGGANAASAAPA